MTFRPGVRLDSSQTQDMRGKTTVRLGGRRLRKRGNMVGGVVLPLPSGRPVLPKIPSIASTMPVNIRAAAPLVMAARLREFRPESQRGPFNPNARIGPNTSVRMAPPIKMNALPRPGDLRSAAISLSRGQIPSGSLLGNIVGTIGRAISGGRKGVPRNVAPVPAPAMNSITPNMVNQSDAGRTVRDALRRRMGTKRSMVKLRRGGATRST